MEIVVGKSNVGLKAEASSEESTVEASAMKADNLFEKAVEELFEGNQRQSIKHMRNAVVELIRGANVNQMKRFVQAPLLNHVITHVFDNEINAEEFDSEEEGRSVLIEQFGFSDRDVDNLIRAEIISFGD